MNITLEWAKEVLNPEDFTEFFRIWAILMEKAKEEDEYIIDPHHVTKADLMMARRRNKRKGWEAQQTSMCHCLHCESLDKLAQVTKRSREMSTIIKFLAGK